MKSRPSLSHRQSAILSLMNRNIVSVRGAVSIPEQGDEESLTVSAIGRLLEELARRNRFTPDDLVNIMFTQTTDLRKTNAAAALRQAAPEYSSVPLFCAAEPEIDGSPGRIIRVLITFTGEKPGVPVYLDRARALRPDLSGD